MINPAAIPQIPGDMAVLGGHATTVSGVGTSFPATGSRVHSTWQNLAPVYQAPEAGQLLAATGPVQTVSASVGQDLTTVGTALSTYATEVTAIKARLEALRTQAQTFVDTIGAKPDWRDDEDDVERHNQLLSDVNAAVADFMAAQRRCANAILACYSEQRYTAENGDGTLTATEFGYTGEQLDGALAQDDGELPWGKTEEHDRGFWGDVGAIFGGMGTAGKNAIIDLGGLIGYAEGDWSWSNAGTAWKGLGIYAVASMFPQFTALNAVVDLPGLKKGTLHNSHLGAGKSLLAYDTWGEDNAKAAGMATFNIVSAVVGTKGAGAGLRNGGAAIQAGRTGIVAKTGAGMVKVGEFIEKLPPTKDVLTAIGRGFGALRDKALTITRHDIPTTHVDSPRNPTPTRPTTGPTIGDAVSRPHAPGIIDRDGVGRAPRTPVGPPEAPTPTRTTVGVRNGVIGRWPAEAPHTSVATPDAPRPAAPLVGSDAIDWRTPHTSGLARDDLSHTDAPAGSPVVPDDGGWVWPPDTLPTGASTPQVVDGVFGWADSPHSVDTPGSPPILHGAPGYSPTFDAPTPTVRDGVLRGPNHLPDPVPEAPARPAAPDTDRADIDRYGDPSPNGTDATRFSPDHLPDHDGPTGEQPPAAGRADNEDPAPNSALDTHDTLWTDPPWQRDGRPPSLDEVLPQGDAEVARWGAVIRETVAGQFEGRTFGGLRLDADPSRIRVGSGFVEFTFDVVDPHTGAVVGTTDHRLARTSEGELVAHHLDTHLDLGVRGRGFSSQLNRYLEDWYRYSGVSHVTLRAASSKGGYTWAAAGFDWAPGSRRYADDVLERVRHQMRVIDDDLATATQLRRQAGPYELSRLQKRYGAENLDDLLRQMEYEKKAGEEILGLAAEYPFRSAGFPTPYDISQAGRADRTGRDTLWIGKAAMLGSDWRGVKIISDSGPLHRRPG